MVKPVETGDLSQGLRSGWQQYVDEIAPARADLYRYCRSLTGTVWDAEDLVQDTLVRAFSRWGVTHPGIDNPRRYLIRTATNVWIDLQRRVENRCNAHGIDPDTSRSRGPGPDAVSDVRDAGARLLQRLSPQEQAAVVLREVFDMQLADIAQILGTTTGAVKAALHRGRQRLEEPEGGAASRRRSVPPELVDRFIERWEAGDVDGLVALMLDNGAFENVGNSFHEGKSSNGGVRDPLTAVVHGHPEWPDELRTTHARRMEPIEYDGERVIAVFLKRAKGDALTNVMRIEAQEDGISRVRSYGFCPETIKTIADSLGVRAWTGIYRAP